MDEQNTVETTATAEETTAVEKEQATPTAKTFTQDELNAIIDKRLERERKDAQARIDKAVTEAQKLAKMSADERAEHERQELQKTLAQREAEITKRELRAEAKSQLSDKGLPVELAEVPALHGGNHQQPPLKAVEKVFRLAVEKGRDRTAEGQRAQGQPARTAWR